jgi:hypothetical protein
MIQINAFHKYLLSIPRDEAIHHVLACLFWGDNDNAAWQLMRDINGPSWSIPPEDLANLINETLDAIDKELS